MKHPLVLTLLLVPLLAACQPLPPPTPAPPPAPPTQVQPPKEEPTSASTPAQQEQPELPTAQQAEAGAAMQGLLDDQVQKQGILGMIMGARLPDGTVITRSAGSTDPAGKNPWSADTISMLASVTKTYTAVVIMQLVEEGKLSLDDTIDKWFPDQPNADVITVRMLLSHTSGLSDFITPENLDDPRWTQEFPPMDAVAEANRLGPVDQPGSRFAHYADTNYFLLGLIIEAITGNSWEQEVRSRIIEPLNLKDTGFVSEEGVPGGIVVEGYFKTPDGYISILEVPNRPSASTAWANGGVVSSLSDLLTFAGALFDGALVSKESLAVMATPVAKEVESGLLWGLGGATMEQLPPGSFGMGGDAEAYHAFFAGVQGTELVVAALVNTAEGDVIGPSLMAFDYLRSLPPAGQQPAPGGAEAPAIPLEIVNRAAEWLAAEVNVPVEDLRLVGAEHVEWTDSCFGLGGPAESCLQAITPGWRMTAEAAGQQYEVRTDESGSAFRLAPQDS